MIPEQKRVTFEQSSGSLARWLACGLVMSLVGLVGTPSLALVHAQTRHANLRVRAETEGSFVQRVPWYIPNPAESLQELVADSYVIAVGQAVTNHSELASNEREVVMVHEVYLLESLKGPVSASDTVLVVVPGGHVDFPDGSYAEWRVNDFRWPEPGNRYLWFLQRVGPSRMDQTRAAGNKPSSPVFEPVHGPLGIYLLDTDLVQASGLRRSRLAARIGLQRLTPGAFTEAVRQLIGGSH